MSKEAVDAFKALNKRNGDKFVVYKFSKDLRSVVLDFVGKKDVSFESYQKTLGAATDAHVRFIVYDFKYDIKSKDDTNRVLMVQWADGSSLENLTASRAFPIIKRNLNGIGATVEDVEDVDELTLANFIKWASEAPRLSKRYRRYRFSLIDVNK
jgi:phage-related protein